MADASARRLRLYAQEQYCRSRVNSAASPYAGAVTAALFLKRFIDEVPWLHFDVMAFNIRKRPGRPEGGEAMDYAAFIVISPNVSEPAMNSIKDLENAASGTQVDLSRFLGWVSFNEQGLVPAIAQDHATGAVLMLAWMNREAIEQTLTTGGSSIFLAVVKRCGAKVTHRAIPKAWSLCDSTATPTPFCSQ